MRGFGGLLSAPGRLARFGVIVAAVWLALLATATSAYAHPVLLFTDPTLDSAVAEPPRSVTLVFNEAVTVNPQAIIVTDLQDRGIPIGKSTTKKEGTIVTAPLIDELATGTYRVRWEATGVDGHGVDGEFRFAVGTAVTGAGTTSSGQAVDWAAALLRWLLLAGFALAFGGIVAERITATAREENPTLPTLHPWSHYGAALGLVGAVASSVALIADVGVPAALWESRPGFALLAETAGFFLALVLIALRRRLWALLPLAVVAVAEGAVSHSNVAAPIIGATLTSVHLVAAALWAGALLHTARAVVAWRSWRPAVRWVLLSYARLAAWVFVVVVVSGLVMALILVPLSALTTTAYGKALLTKLALVVAAAALALTGRWALRRRQERLGRVRHAARLESSALIAVLAASAVLVSTPNPGAAVAAPPPPPQGVAVPAGGLAGQVGINVVASKNQAVVRLSTPRPGNYYEQAAQPDYELSGQLSPPRGPSEPVKFRSCGGGCFVAPVAWRRGDNILTLRAAASGWRGGSFAARIPWPVRPADELVERTVRVMRRIEEFTLYESGTSNSATGLPEPRQLSVDGKTFLSNEPYNSGVAPVAARVTTESGTVRLLMGFPAANAHAEVTLDGLGRITEETLTGPKHLFKRRFLYPDQQ